MNARTYTSRNVIAGYLSVYTLFTLASSVIWAINTIFLMREGGLTIFQVMIVNSVFTVGQMVFEVPTGVVADTIGRRASLLLAMVTLAASTLLYVLTPAWGWGIWGFIGASVILGLGFTFETGALDAWLVDALDATGSERPKERVFAWGQMAGGGGMLVGSLLGGVLGQIGLSVPYVVRTVLLVVAAVLTALLIHDAGFTPRPLKFSTFGDETRNILQAGTTFGWRSRVVRPLLWGSLASGVFFIYGFYSWQPYVLDLLGRDYVWLLGVVTAAFSLMGIGGNRSGQTDHAGGRTAPRTRPRAGDRSLGVGRPGLRDCLRGPHIPRLRESSRRVSPSSCGCSSAWCSASPLRCGWGTSTLTSLRPSGPPCFRSTPSSPTPGAQSVSRHWAGSRSGCPSRWVGSSAARSWRRPHSSTGPRARPLVRRDPRFPERSFSRTIEVELPDSLPRSSTDLLHREWKGGRVELDSAARGRREAWW